MYKKCSRVTFLFNFIVPLLYTHTHTHTHTHAHTQYAETFRARLEGLMAL